MGQNRRRSRDDRTRNRTPKESGEEVPVAADDERQGRISLWLSLVGLVLPVLLAMVFAVLLERNILREPGTYYGLCLLLGGVLELAALGCGLGARRTTAGKTGLFLSLAFLVLLVLVLAFTTSSVRMAPVQQELAPDAQP
jgi:hypothetical protein